MNIKAYLKPHCGWSKGVRAILRKYSLPFEDCDIFNDPDLYTEMVRKSGQPLSPCARPDRPGRWRSRVPRRRPAA